VLSLGTSIFTLLALAPQAAVSTKVSLKNSLPVALSAFRRAVASDSRFFILAICDMLKLVLSLALLAHS